MPSNQAFQDFITDLATEIDNANDRMTPALKRATVHQLRELSSVRNSFMEASFSFSTIADSEAYDLTNTAGFPQDILEIFHLYGVEDSSYYPIRGPVPIREVRLRTYDNYNYPWPEMWAWHNNQLILAPTPSQAETLNFDYFRDGTRDSATGNEITVASTTDTNGWFGRGINALRSSVLWEYYASVAKDEKMAAFHWQQRQVYVDTIETEWHMRQLKGAQAAWTYGDY